MIKTIRHEKYDKKLFKDIKPFDFFIGRHNKASNINWIYMKIPQIDMRDYCNGNYPRDNYIRNAILITSLDSVCYNDCDVYINTKDVDIYSYVGFDLDAVITPLKSELIIHHKGKIK